MVSEEKMKSRAMLKRLQLIVHAKGADDDVPEVIKRLKAAIDEIEPELIPETRRVWHGGRDRKHSGGRNRER